ncbi:MAG: hypothetical protein CL908_10030 [Deltaproteobacteria bacterium]|nr:hypothetical protein [Deltaproteobacteria bacterium]
MSRNHPAKARGGKTDAAARHSRERPKRIVPTALGPVVLAVILAPSGASPARAQGTEAEIASQAEVPSAQAQFTTGVENREPVDQITFVGTSVDRIYFFSDLRGFAGQTVIHRWIYDGETMAEVPFEVRGPRWRVWSQKSLLPDWIGDWSVEIVNAEGEIVAAETFTYSAPDS